LADTTATSTTSAPSISITGLTDGLKDLQTKGKVDLKLSPATRDRYLALIRQYQTSLKIERDRMNGLETLGYPGPLSSAQQTRANLQLDVTDLTGAQRTIDKYLDYLDELQDTVKKACDQLMKSG
jgi:hypothetical protein